MVGKSTRFMSASAQLPQLKQGMGGLFINSQLRTKAQYPPSTTSLTGQTGMVTGSNVGIGFACADMLIGLGLTHLILAVRSQAKGDATAAALRKKHPSSKAVIETFLLDMESYDSIRDLARRCAALPRLDFAILNAGCSEETLKIVPSTGHERLMQVNFLSTMLLAVLLLPVLKRKSPSARPGQLTIVSSGLSMHGKFPQHAAPRIIPAFDDPATFEPADNYSTVKFLIHLFLDELVQHVSADDVVVNCVDPGLVRGTQLHRSIGGLPNMVLGTMKSLAGRSLQAGAATYVDAAVLRGKESHGCFLMDYKIAPYGNFYYTPERPDAQARLWKEMMEEFSFVDMQSVISSISK